MKNLRLKIELLSPTLIASAEGFGAVIDSDIVFDKYGIPYIPSKRIKGCLRDSATEVCEIFSQSGINIFDLSIDNGSFSIVNSLFGKPGEETPCAIRIYSLFLSEYDNLVKWIDYMKKTFPQYFNPEAVRDYFTEIRQQTSIDDDGIAKSGSLRSIRVADKGIIFEGDIELIEKREDFLILLYFSALNLTRVGTKRTRGFGKIECRILEGEKELDFLSKLEVQ